MCSPVRCRKCGKTTWSGCGQHIEQALAGVPKEQRCTCGSKPSGAQQPAAAPQGKSGFFKMFGR